MKRYPWIAGSESARSARRAAFSLVGGALGIFSGTGGPPVSVGLFVAVPIAGFIGAYAASPLLRAALRSIPLWQLTAAHVWRFVGLGFTLGAAARALPWQFGYPEGIGDMVAAAGAIPLALLLAKRPDGPRLKGLYRAWNVYGLLDLVSAISLGILYSPSSFGVLRSGVSTLPMSQFPVSLIPTFFVPLFILAHLLGLARSGELSAGEEASGGSAGEPLAPARRRRSA